jgi:ABC-type branched-subunit amino acid transport system permease subunit
MRRNIPTGQLIGTCVEHALWFAVGAYFAWVRPRRLRQQAESGKISEEQSRVALKKLSPLLGYLIMAAAVAFTLSEFF